MSDTKDKIMELAKAYAYAEGGGNMEGADEYAALEAAIDDLLECEMRYGE